MERTYFQPRTLTEAIELLSTCPADSTIVAGGTDLLVAHRGGKKRLPSWILAIHRIDELHAVTTESDGSLRVGSLVTHGELESSSVVRDRYTALADAAALVGSPATRHVATLGGNLCNASPAMEAGSPLLVFDTVVELASNNGIRRVMLDQFLCGPGQTELTDGDLLTAVVLAAVPAGKLGSAYLRLEYRLAIEIAIVGAAAVIILDSNGRCDEARVAVTAVAPTCLRVSPTEAALRGRTPDPHLLEQASKLATAVARPIDDVRGSSQYRSSMLVVIVRRALELAWRRARGERLPVPAGFALESFSQ